MIYSTEEEKENLKKYIHNNKVEERDNIFKYYGGNMKIIDILNMIARGETPPKKILIRFKDINERIINEETFEYSEKFKDYFDEHDDRLFEDYDWIEILNEPVEILETTITYTPNELKWGGKIKKIARCDEHDMTDYGEIYKPRFNEEILRRKINEIIDKVNEL